MPPQRGGTHRLRTLSGTTCHCTAGSCGSRMREPARAPGGSSTLTAGRVARRPGGGPSPWTTATSTPRAAAVQPRRRQPCRPPPSQQMTVPPSSPSGPAAPHPAAAMSWTRGPTSPRTNSNASTVSGRLSPILASTELDDAQDDDAPLSPCSIAARPACRLRQQAVHCGAARLTDMAGTMNLNDGLADNLMDDLLDNIALPASQPSPPGGLMQRSSSFPYTTKGSGLGSPTSSFSSAVFGPSSLNSLRQSPMQTIQENKPATFSSMSHNSNKYTKSRGRAAKKKAALQTAPESADDSPSQLSKWPGSPTSRSSDELDAWTDFRSRTNSNASTVSGRLSPILASTELDDVQDDDAPLSPMLYSSSASLSPSVSKPCTVELPRLTDMAGTMNLNDGLADNLMDDLLDNIALPASQPSPPGGLMQRSSSFPYTTKGSGLGSPTSSFSSAVFGPSSLNSLRQSPMQTIQENKPATFSSMSHYGNQTLQDLLTSDSLSHSDVMMTQSDPLMSQASTAVSAQNSRRNVMLRSDPMMSFAAQPNQGSLVNQNLLHHQHQTQGALGGSRALSNSVSNMGLSDSSSLGSAKHQQQSPVSQSMQTLSDSLSGSSLYSTSANLPVMGHEKFPSDLDLDMFNGSLECDMESIIRSELMDADGLDFNFDSLISTQNVVGLNVGSFTGAKQASSQSWVPG
uniref:Forkhead box O3 n=1 Tax=Bos mutus grunniens TaxID=30521 RepID=A0A8B9WS45_BOSMU